MIPTLTTSSLKLPSLLKHRISKKINRNIYRFKTTNHHTQKPNFILQTNTTHKQFQHNFKVIKKGNRFMIGTNIDRFYCSETREEEEEVKVAEVKGIEDYHALPGPQQAHIRRVISVSGLAVAIALFAAPIVGPVTVRYAMDNFGALSLGIVSQAVGAELVQYVGGSILVTTVIYLAVSLAVGPLFFCMNAVYPMFLVKSLFIASLAFGTSVYTALNREALTTNNDLLQRVIPFGSAIVSCIAFSLIPPFGESILFNMLSSLAVFISSYFLYNNIIRNISITSKQTRDEAETRFPFAIWSLTIPLYSIIIFGTLLCVQFQYFNFPKFS